jgi:predicted transcriptional regulator
MIHLKDIETVLHSDQTVRNYIKSNENERRQMYEKLVSSLEEEEEEEGEEEEEEENSIKAIPNKRRKIETENSYDSDDESYLSE